MDTSTSQEFVDAVNAATNAQMLTLKFRDMNKDSLSRADMALLDTVFALNKQAFDLLFKVGRL